MDLKTVRARAERYERLIRPSMSDENRRLDRVAGYKDGLRERCPGMDLQGARTRRNRPGRGTSEGPNSAWTRSIWKECGITGKTVRNAKARAKERGRMVEIYCGSAPMVSVYPDGKLKLSGRGG